MSKTLAAAAAVLLSLGAPASAHRLDEYLEATLISVEKDRVQAFMRLIPGVAVSSMVISSIDTNGDGILSETEQRTYAERVLGDLSLSIDGHLLKPRLVSANFPRIEEMREGLGEIQMEFTADLPRGGAHRRLVFENHHQSQIAAYLVNCLAVRDESIQIAAQTRNENQSFYQLDYMQADGRPDPRSLGWPSGVRASLGAIALILSAGLVLKSRRAKAGIAG
ncbi:MAG TPA: hypothetical protein VKG25_28410 [Bryobacteraceae bacterium]|nr:hypothetical protein [Bryobacteraceae bacterium]